MQMTIGFLHIHISYDTRDSFGVSLAADSVRRRNQESLADLRAKRESASKSVPNNRNYPSSSKVAVDSRS